MRLMDENRADILIVGAGVLGAGTALALARAGHDVLVIERNAGVGDGSTGASAGIIRVHASDPQSSALADDSLVRWRSWAEFLGAEPGEELARFVTCGSLILDAANGFTTQAAGAMTEAGVGFETWDLARMSERFPYMDFHRFGPPTSIDDEAFWEEPTEYLSGGLFTPQSGYVGDPTLAAVNLMNAAVRAGARVRLSATVARIDVAGNRVTGVTLSDGTSLHAEATIVIAGPNTDELIGEVGARADFGVRTRRLREELLHIPGPPGVDLGSDGVHLVDGDLNINFRPDGGAALLGGSNGDLAGEHVTIDDADVFERRTTAAAWEQGTLRLARRIPSLGVPRERTGVVGLYDAAEDWLPIYDRTAFDGLFVAMGTSGTQFKTAPIVGDLMRHIVENELAGRDHTAVPFASPVSDRRFSTAQFSRLRSPMTGQARG